MKDNFYDRDQLENLGFKYLGNNLRISKNAIFYGAENISIGSNSRIDDFCLLSASANGEIILGKFVHISAGSYFFGKGGIILGDFAGVSAGSKIFSETDDFSGDYLTNPTIPSQYRNVDSQLVLMERHSIIGAGSLLLPGAVIPEGTAVGAMSIVNKKLEPWGIYVGQPVRRVKDRSKNLMKLESRLMAVDDDF